MAAKCYPVAANCYSVAANCYPVADIFGGLGPTFIIGAFGAKNQLFAIFFVKIKIQKHLIAC